MENNIIREAESEWASPAVLVKKKDGTWRFCMDYRKLNAVSKSIAYPIPSIDNIIASFANVKYITKCDCTSGFFQIPMHPNSIYKTAFVVADGSYVFNKMPFGLQNSTQTYQQTMNSILRHLRPRGVLIYIDDIIIISKTFKEHLETIQSVFTILQEHDIKLKPSKCSFAQFDIEILGHQVGREGIRPCNDKLLAIQNIPTPTKLKEAQSFIGICNFLQKIHKRLFNNM